MVLLDPAQPIAMSFGPASFQMHRQIAQDRARELMAPEIALDVDTADDLRQLADGVEPQGADVALSQLLRDWRNSARPIAGSDTSLTNELLESSLDRLVARAAQLRDAGHGPQITYSRKVFLPLTHLCRDSCHYCTFARAPRSVAKPYMSIDEAVEVATRGARLGCHEVLLTLGERPELRYRAAREWLDSNGYESTLHYVAAVAGAVRERTGLLPHINAGTMSEAELAILRPVSASMGLMLESASARLCARGGPHHGSPDKVPAVRLATIDAAGRMNVPFTSGILVGIGETRVERIEALLAIRESHQRHGHIQEIIIQNFLPKAGTRMAAASAAPADEFLWTIAVARILFGPTMNIQAPPNLSPVALDVLLGAGINDWGGVSPLTPDFVNPEAPWPEIQSLRAQTEAAGKILVERLTIYPRYAMAAERWLDPLMRRAVLEQSDAAALARENSWCAGISAQAPDLLPSSRRRLLPATPIARRIGEIVERGAGHLDTDEVAGLFEARGPDFARLCQVADAVRSEAVGDRATFVVNRNINYTNICGYHCSFCAFSKGPRKHAGAEKPYLLDMQEIADRVGEARAKGATEVCLQGGIHPKFTGATYLEILRAVKRRDPAMHVHAFSPLEVWHGATTLGMPLHHYLAMLRDEGLGSLPGTAAEILHDPVRRILCPDKLTSDQWLQVIGAAHDVGLRTTATIMFGHVDRYRDWAIHLLRLRDLQDETGGFTEFVPLAFVAPEAPLYKRGQARPGPTLREAILMHAVARLVLCPQFENIQASWVKLGRAGMRMALLAGANDLGGTLMNESITRAAGALHGQEMTGTEMDQLAASLGRRLVQRNTLYQEMHGACRHGALNAVRQWQSALPVPS
jgi:FO synthase